MGKLFRDELVFRSLSLSLVFQVAIPCFSIASIMTGIDVLVLISFTHQHRREGEGKAAHSYSL